jgi:hypothetical protein
VTVVVSLTSAGVDFEGGLYVSVGAGSEVSVALQRGDAVIHRSNLLHGVRVEPGGERWSWIMWRPFLANWPSLCVAFPFTQLNNWIMLFNKRIFFYRVI